MTARALLVALVLACLSAACKKSEGGASSDAGATGDRSKSLTPEEVGQGMQLCRGYVQRLCHCAATETSLTDECDLARSQPDGLAMTVRFLAGSEGPISTRERLEAEAGARKIIAPVRIGPGARIDAHAVVGPDTVIGARAHVLPGVPIERSVVWPDSRVTAPTRGAIVTPQGTVALN